MSDVKRYAFQIHRRPYGLEEISSGNLVMHSDYAKLEAEAKALRDRLENECKIAAFWNEQAEKYKAEAEALRARVVVVPSRDSGGNYYEEGWNACLDELARLNGKAVSEGLLRRLSDLFPADMGDDCSGRAGWLPHVRETVAELRALLGEGKEHE